MGQASYREYLAGELARVEGELLKHAQCAAGEVAEVIGSIVRAGGKRLRPALVFLGGEFGRYDVETLLPVAVAAELIHTASLMHDDIIDGSAMRRGRPTAHMAWGTAAAVFAGDFLFTRALSLLAGLGRSSLTNLACAAVAALCEGEMEELASLHRVDVTVTGYLKRTRRKTAWLFAWSTWAGAVVSGASRRLAQKLWRYGRDVGMAYQINDDVVDFGADMARGVYALPVIYAMRRPAGRGLGAMLGSRAGESDLARAISLVREAGGMEAAGCLARAYGRRAKRALAGLPESHARHLLSAVADEVSAGRV